MARETLVSPGECNRGSIRQRGTSRHVELLEAADRLCDTQLLRLTSQKMRARSSGG